ncbi:MAG TPA: alpha/beta hydrolase [Bryobacteraceae bacterium]|nr:alpha/beta hydrolase [Bryobacteraceae bacterium]
MPGYLVEPNKEGKFAAVIWGHWMMPGSPTANRKEFLDEAIAIAPAGVISLLIDAPYVRPGFKADPHPLSSQHPDVLAEQVIDLRRGADMLSALNNVDANRIGYVGHSFDAAAGAILDAVDKRFRAFVFMGGPQSIREYVLTASTPDVTEFRNSVPRPELLAYLDRYAWADPGTYVKQLGPAPAFFQYALNDDYVPVADAKRFYQMCSGPKKIEFYNATHALNAHARRDRFEFLREKLNLANLPAGALDAVPEIK